MDQNNQNGFSQNSGQVPYQQAYQQSAYQPPAVPPVAPDTYVGDPRFKPMGAWAYAGYSLLYSLVPFGWIVAIVHAVDNNNITRRNFARGFWCKVLIGIILGVLVAILAAVLGVSVFRALNRSW